MGLPPFSAGSLGHLRDGWRWLSLPMDFSTPSTHFLTWLGEGGVRLGMHRIGVLVLAHPSPLIPGLVTSLGYPLGGFPLGCGRGQLRAGTAGPGRRAVAPRFLPSDTQTSQQHGALPKAAPVVRAAVITQGRGQSQGHVHPAAWSHWLRLPHPPHLLLPKPMAPWPWVGRAVCTPGLRGEQHGQEGSPQAVLPKGL